MTAINAAGEEITGTATIAYNNVYAILGAAYEEITITDAEGTSQTITTGADGVGYATLTQNTAYTLTGGVSGYAYNVVAPETTDEPLYCRPKRILYWYGVFDSSRIGNRVGNGSITDYTNYVRSYLGTGSSAYAHIQF